MVGRSLGPWWVLLSCLVLACGGRTASPSDGTEGDDAGRSYSDDGGSHRGGRASGGVAAGGVGAGGVGAGGVGAGGVGTGGVETGGAETGGAETGGAETGGAETGGAETGGAGQGGSGVAGGGDTGTGGSGDAGAAGHGAVDICSQPLTAGPCSALTTVYHHRPELGMCVPTVVDTCSPSPNQFATRDECLAACSGGYPNYDACASSSDCRLYPVGCCGGCDGSGAEAFVAINWGHWDEYETVTGCLDEICDECAFVAPNQQTAKYLYPACLGGQCTVRDVREQPIAECVVATDCQLRCGAACCNSCSARGGVVAVRAGIELEDELCGAAEVVCDPCECDIPEEYSVDCVEGVCAVVLGPVCEFGADHTCNADVSMSSIKGTCNADGSCTCDAAAAVDPATGRCY